MSTMEKSKLLDQIKAELKVRGFKKDRNTWRKYFDDTIAVFNVQTSQWNSDDFFINLGIYLKILGNHQKPPEFKCHVRTRLDFENKSISVIATEAMEWFEKRSTISGIQECSIEDSRKGLVVKEIRNLKIET